MAEVDPTWRKAKEILSERELTTSRTVLIDSKVERARLKREERMQQRASGAGSTEPRSPEELAKRNEKRVDSQWRVSDPKARATRAHQAEETERLTVQLAQEEFLLSQKKRLEDEDKWRLRDVELAKAVEVKADERRTKIGIVLLNAKEKETVDKSKIVEKHVTVMGKSAKLVEEEKAKKLTKIAAFRDEETKKMEHAHVRQLEMKEQRKMKVESDFAQRQSKTEGLQQLEAERRERLLSARMRKEEAVKQKGEQIKEQAKELQQQKHQQRMEKLQSTAANRLESLASRTLKVKRNASAKRTEVLVKISLEAEARQAKVGSWTSKDADRTRKLQQRKAAEKEINDATIVRAQATVIERSALETRAFLAASGYIRAIPGMELLAAAREDPQESQGAPAEKESAALPPAPEPTAAEETT